MQGAGEDILAAVVGSEDMDAAFVDAKQMRVEREPRYAEVQHFTRQIDVIGEVFVLPPFDKEMNVSALFRVNLGHPAEVRFGGSRSA